MRRSPLDHLVTQKTLESMDTNGFLLDAIAEDTLVHNVELKNVCAKVHPELAAEIDNICGLLGISKRRFLEAAFVEAINQAKAIMDREGFHEWMAERGEPL